MTDYGTGKQSKLEEIEDSLAVQAEVYETQAKNVKVSSRADFAAGKAKACRLVIEKIRELRTEKKGGNEDE